MLDFYRMKHTWLLQMVWNLEWANSEPCIKAWVVVELFSTLALLYSYHQEKLSSTSQAIGHSKSPYAGGRFSSSVWLTHTHTSRTNSTELPSQSVGAHSLKCCSL